MLSIMQTIIRKSPWLSKINWVQGGAMTCMLATYFGIDIPPEVQAAVQALIVAATTITTWIMRTWFTPGLTTS